MNRWLLSAIGLELHQGSHGRSSVADTAPLSGTTRGSSNMGLRHDLVSMSQPSSHSTDGFARIERIERQANADEDDLDESQDEGIDDDDMDELHNPEHHEARMIFNNQNVLMDEELANSDEDMMDIDFADEEMVAFVEQPLGVARRPLTQHPLHPMTGDLLDDTSDDNSDGHSSNMSEKDCNVDSKFAGVSWSSVIPYQPSLLGLVNIGLGKRGSPFDFDSASKVMRDLSHLGMIHRKGIPTKCLIRLPKSFVELYGLVNRVRGRDETSATDDADDVSSSETAICLLTGAVMRSGSSRRAYASTVGL